MTLKEQPEHVERRARWARARNRPSAPKYSEAFGIGPVDLRAPSASTRKDRGEFYTTKQAALRLGVAPATVRTLRDRGRLTGVHRKSANQPRGGKQWWFFRKDEVEALAADSLYLRRSLQGKEAQRIKRGLEP